MTNQVLFHQAVTAYSDRLGPMRNVKNTFILALIAVLWGALFYKIFYGQREAPMFDYVPTYVAAKMIGDSDLKHHIYDRNPVHLNRVPPGPFSDIARRIGFIHPPTPYVYPPFYAWMLQPVRSLTYEASKGVVLFLGALAFILGFSLAFLDFGGRLPWRLVFLVAPVLFLYFTPLNYNNWLGQISTIIFGLICVSLWLAKRGRIVPAGIILGFCLTVKIQPIGIPILLLARKKFKLTLVAALSAIVLLLLSGLMAGPEVLRQYVTTLFEITSKGSLASWNNQTIVGLLLRATNPVPMMFQWRYIEPATWMTLIQTLVSLGLIGWVVLGGRLYRQSGGSPKGKTHAAEETPAVANDYVLAYLGGILISLVLPPIVWNHAHVLAVLPLLWLVSTAIEREPMSRRLLWLSAISVGWLLVSLNPDTIARNLFPPASPDASGGFASLACSAGLFGVLLLAVLFALAVSASTVKK